MKQSQLLLEEWRGGHAADLVLFEETKAAALQRLSSLSVRAPLDGISHRRHRGGRVRRGGGRLVGCYLTD